MSFLNLFADNKIKYGDSIFLKTSKGTYLSYLRDGRVITEAKGGIAQTLSVETYFGKSGNLSYGSFLFLRNSAEMFLSAEADFSLTSNGLVAHQWELFQLVDPHNPEGQGLVEFGYEIALQTAHKKFVTSSKHVISAYSEKIGPTEIFIIEKSQHKFNSVQSVHRFVSSPVLNFFDFIKIKHINTGNVLHSHPYNYSTGTKFQQVTCYDRRDNNDWWQIIPTSLDQTGPVYFGNLIKIRHEATGRQLHSFAGIESPISGQQEVSCHNGVDDLSDRWRIDGGIGKVEAGLVIHIAHATTRFKLHSHPIKFGTGFYKQQEVTCYGSNDDNNDWKVIEIRGLYFKE